VVPRADRPHANEAITSDASALALATCDPDSRDANAPAAPRSLGCGSWTGPPVALTATPVPVAGTRPGVLAGRGALAAAAAGELGDLGRNGGLHQQLRTEPRHLLQHYRQLPTRSKQLIDTAMDARDRRFRAQVRAESP
jgi:hypothetical protein